MSTHVSGIGGVGMSALAQALLDQGVGVTGSDRLLDQGDLTDTLACLKAQGVRLHPQDGSGITPQTERLVISSAIEADNPDVLQAQKLGIPIIHRAAELARLTSGHRLIAVTGTCGKSTVTALLGHLLDGTGFDPLVVNGAAVAGWDTEGTRLGSVRKPRSPETGWAVIEADESDKSLTVFDPEHTIITNASADHFGLAETQEIFSSFCAKVPGVVIDGRDGADSIEDVRLDGWNGFFTFEGVPYRVPMPGAHNVFNAWYAVRMARALGAPVDKLVAALAAFGGVERRLQRVGTCGGAAVVDDYAHNPEKLAAAWRTLSEAFPAGVCAVWRPHGYAPLRKMMDDLAEMFARVCRPQDTLLLPPVYDAGGTADRSVNSDILASLLKEKGVKVDTVQTLEEAEAWMRGKTVAGSVLVTFGARDPGLPRLARKLAAGADSTRCKAEEKK